MRTEAEQARERPAAGELVVTRVLLRPSVMHGWLSVLTVALATTVAQAQEGDPLKSAECHGALEALQAQETAAAALREADRPADPARERAARSRLETLRHRAARACLGAPDDRPPPAGRMAQPPMAAPPTRPAPPAQQPPLEVAPVVPPATRAAPPVVITSCDSTGCWASDGSRLQRVGPRLLGPRGLCTRVGNVLQCR